MQKVLLGLLDAKINMLAHLQNAAQLLTSRFFLDSNYDGSLVFNRDTVRNFKKVCPKEFSAFKDLQSTLIKSEVGMSLLTILDGTVGNFVDVLLEKNDSAYLKIVGNIPENLPEITQGAVPGMRQELSDAFLIFRSFFELLDLYVREGSKKSHKDSPKKPDRFEQIKQTALSKIIRPYREENDPLIMMKTAQNALNVIIQKGYNQKEQVLHILGVNYGGALVGLFAKQVFLKTVKHGQVLANTGNITYSIYDVKNANDFLHLTNYPVAEVVKRTMISPEEMRRMHDRNWLLIFDDNTNSGETLDNLRKRATETGLYGKIDVFACRASRELGNYKKSLTDDEKLDFVINSAVASRKSRVIRFLFSFVQ